MNEDEKEEVGVKVMEALEENFETHQEKINLLVSGHTKLDCDEDEEEEDVEEERDDVMETDKPDETREDHLLPYGGNPYCVQRPAGEHQEALRHPPRPGGGQRRERELRPGRGGPHLLPREEEGQAALLHEGDRPNSVPARGGSRLPRPARRSRQVFQRLRQHAQQPAPQTQS